MSPKASMPSPSLTQEVHPNALGTQPQKVFNVGDSVQIFSKSINAWVDGRVSEVIENDCVMVEYGIGATWYTKMLHRQSQELATASASCQELVSLGKIGPNAPAVASATLLNMGYQLAAGGIGGADSDLLRKAKSFDETELPQKEEKRRNSRSAITLMNEGTRLSEQEDFAGAMEKFVEAEQLFQETRATRTPGYAVLFKHMGDCSVKKGELRDAMEQYERAKSLYEAVHATRMQDYPTLLESMGTLVRKQGNLEKAMKLYTKAEQALDRADLNETPDYKRLIEAIEELKFLQVPEFKCLPRRTPPDAEKDQSNCFSGCLPLR